MWVFVLYWLSFKIEVQWNRSRFVTRIKSDASFSYIISLLSGLLTLIVHEFCYNNPRAAVLYRCNTAALIYKFIWFLLSVQHSVMTEMKTACLICLKH